MEISGDIYDFFDWDKDSALICFGDSSGKSAAARSMERWSAACCAVLPTAKSVPRS
jgi:hypothetical protein